MTADTKTTEKRTFAPLPTRRQVGVLSEEELTAWLNAAEICPNDPEEAAYVQRLWEGAKEARRQINAEDLRHLDAEEGK